MLKRISPREVTLGMYVHSLQGEWLSHPFWRSQFLVTRSEQLDALRRSGVSAVVIDLDRCDASLAPKRPQGPARKPSTEFSAARRIEDLQVAKRVAADARRSMKKIFEGAGGAQPTAAVEIDAVVNSIAQTLDRNRSMLLGVIRLKSSDEYTYFHSVSVGTLMINFARELGLPEEEVRLMGIGGLFHDIGKTRVSSAILNKPGKLTDEEFDEIKQHPGRGHELLMMTDNVPPVALDVCLHHHEKMDGRGYPFGLAGSEISLAARMGAICDVYDALTSTRAYKDASSPIAAITSMAGWKGHFDPELLFVFMKSIGVFQIGMLIRLRTGHLAIVRDNGRRASRARLTVFYDLAAQRLLPPRDIYLSDIKDSDLILEPADPEAMGLYNWAELSELLLAGRDPSVNASS